MIERKHKLRKLLKIKDLHNKMLQDYNWLELSNKEALDNYLDSLVQINQLR